MLGDRLPSSGHDVTGIVTMKTSDKGECHWHLVELQFILRTPWVKGINHGGNKKDCPLRCLRSLGTVAISEQYNVTLKGKFRLLTLVNPWHLKSEFFVGIQYR